MNKNGFWTGLVIGGALGMTAALLTSKAMVIKANKGKSTESASQENVQSKLSEDLNNNPETEKGENEGV